MAPVMLHVALLLTTTVFMQVDEHPLPATMTKVSVKLPTLPAVTVTFWDEEEPTMVPFPEILHAQEVMPAGPE